MLPTYSQSTTIAPSRSLRHQKAPDHNVVTAYLAIQKDRIYIDTHFFDCILLNIALCSKYKGLFSLSALLEALYISHSIYYLTGIIYLRTAISVLFLFVSTREKLS